jgi:hypothetical protein
MKKMNESSIYNLIREKRGQLCTRSSRSRRGRGADAAGRQPRLPARAARAVGGGKRDVVEGRVLEGYTKRGWRFFIRAKKNWPRAS